MLINGSNKISTGSKKKDSKPPVELSSNIFIKYSYGFPITIKYVGLVASRSSFCSLV